MEEDRMRGQIASSATRRLAAVEYARGIMPVITMALGANRKANGSFNMSGIARYLNDRGYPTPTEEGEFKSEQVSRVLFRTEETIEAFANIEFASEVRLLAMKAETNGTEPDADKIACLKAVRDRIVHEGKALGRQLRCEDVAPAVRMSLEETARLIIHQVNHRARKKGWDENREYGLGESFENWCRRVLEEALN